MTHLRRDECTSIFAIRIRMIETETKTNYTQLHTNNTCRWCESPKETQHHIIEECPQFKDITQNLTINKIMGTDIETLQKESQQIKAIVKRIKETQ